MYYVSVEIDKETQNLKNELSLLQKEKSALEMQVRKAEEILKEVNNVRNHQLDLLSKAIDRASNTLGTIPDNVDADAYVRSAEIELRSEISEIAKIDFALEAKIRNNIR